MKQDPFSLITQNFPQPLTSGRNYESAGHETEFEDSMAATSRRANGTNESAIDKDEKAKETRPQDDNVKASESDEDEPEAAVSALAQSQDDPRIGKAPTRKETGTQSNQANTPGNAAGAEDALESAMARLSGVSAQYAPGKTDPQGKGDFSTTGGQSDETIDSLNSMAKAASAQAESDQKGQRFGGDNNPGTTRLGVLRGLASPIPGQQPPFFEQFSDLLAETALSHEPSAPHSFAETAFGTISAGRAITLADNSAVNQRGPAMMRQIADALVNSTTHEIEVTLSPEELGRIRIVIGGSELARHVTVWFDRADACDAARRHMEQLRQDLNDSGFADAQLDFRDDAQRHSESPIFSENSEDDPTVISTALSPEAKINPHPARPLVENGRIDIRI